MVIILKLDGIVFNRDGYILISIYLVLDIELNLF